MENNLNICYKVTENNIQNRLDYNTKDFFNIKTCLSLVKLEKSFIPSSKLAQGVQDGKLAIFPVYTKCEVREIKNYLDSGFTCYLLPYSDYRTFKKYYKSL